MAVCLTIVSLQIYVDSANKQTDFSETEMVQLEPKIVNYLKSCSTGDDQLDQDE